MIQRQDYPTYVYLHSDMVMTNWNEVYVKEYEGNKNIYVDKKGKTDEEVEAAVAAYYEISEEQHFANEKAKEEEEHKHDLPEMPEVEE